MNEHQLDMARRVAYLITGYIRNDLTLLERQELDEWIAQSNENMKMFAKLTDKENLLESKKWFDALDTELAHTNITRQTKIKKNVLVRMPAAWIAAASVIISISITVIWQWNSRMKMEPPSVNKQKPIVNVPGSKKAMLITAEGEKLDLAAPNLMAIKIDDKSQATNLNSVLSYNQKSGTVALHILQTPRGGEYQLVLADGTKVWLNAASSLRYPTVFIGTTRMVELEGEAYFEVAHQAQHPFEVRCGKTTVTVIGTKFNINAYPSAGNQKVALLNGSVRLKNNEHSNQLYPGEIAIVTPSGNFEIKPDILIERNIAWTKGKFSFEKTPLKEVLDQLARWYDIDYRLETGKQQEFTGEIFRNSSLEQVLQMLQLSTGDQFVINGKLIIVRP